VTNETALQSNGKIVSSFTKAIGFGKTAPTSHITKTDDVEITTTLQHCEYAKLLAWIDKQEIRPTEAEAVRAFVLAGLRLIDNA
jgi:hypothetical protein